MKFKKTIIFISLIIIIILIIFLVLKYNKKEYTDDYTTKELYNEIDNILLNSDDYDFLEDDIIYEFIDYKPSYIKDYLVIKAKNTKNINEIGIFKVEKNSTKEMKYLAAQYVLKLQKSYRSMDYFPEEVEKIDYATVKVFGNYVVYSFLNETDTKAVYDAIKNKIFH